MSEQVPRVAWFARQREALGLEAMLYAFIAIGNTIRTLTLTLTSKPNPSRDVIGGCEEVIQWGFDETSLDGQACFNQWCLIRTTGKEHSIVTIECSGILPDSVAEETVRHIAKTWARGQVP
jgi:hypothetical protein